MKPGNVLLTRSGTVKVTDFGIARAGTSDGLTQTGSVMGTATYFSPEQAQGLAVDGRSDVYSVGVVLYELVCGVAPFVAESPVSVAYKHVREEPIPPSQRNPEVPAALEQIIMTALAKDPEHRYQSADDLRADLLRFRRGRPLVAAPITAIVAEVPTATVASAGIGAYGSSATVASPRVPVDPSSHARPRAAAPAPSCDVHDPHAARARRRRRWHPLRVDEARRQPGHGHRAPGRGQDATAGHPGPRGATSLRGFQAGRERQARRHRCRARPEVGRRREEEQPGDDQRERRRRIRGPSRRLRPDRRRREQRLTKAGFQVAVDAAQSSKTVDPGAVIATVPADPGSAQLGSTIHIIPSSGVNIPNVLNFPQATAAVVLTNAGLTPQAVPTASNTVPTGNVIRTDPAPGTNGIASGSTIRVYISTGASQVTVPNVIGSTVAKAQDQLSAKNLQSSVVFTPTSQKGNDGKVLNQNPIGGVLADPQSTVVLTVGSFTPPPPTTPTSPSTTTTTGP